MDASVPSLTGTPRLGRAVARLDFRAIAVWALGFLLVVYLGLKGGGHGPLIRNELGITVWWSLLLGLAIGALPLNGLRYGSLVALALFAAYVCWSGASVIWSDAPEKTVADLGRVVTYLGVFALALSIRDSQGARRMVGAVGTAIVAIASVALLSRFHPAWFPEAGETTRLLSDVQNRLAYPLGYWNGVAALVAIGLPLVLHIATSARHVVAQALAAAALPAMMLTIYLTFSRGGTIAAALALALFLVLVPDRVPKSATLLAAGGGGAILCVAVSQRQALNAGLTGPLAHAQGEELLFMTLVVCIGVGLLQTGLALAIRRGRRPAWTRPSRRKSLVFLSGTVVAGLLVALALGAPAKVSSAWDEFQAAKGVDHGADRFTSFSSNGRWPYWRATIDENATAPLIGTGSGSFEAWWAQHGSGEGFVQDAHSLYFETFGELGIVGLVLIVGFLGWIFVVGGRCYLRAANNRRPQIAAALAGCAAFCCAAAADWLWELAVVPIAFLLLASVLVSAGERRRRGPLPLPVIVAGVVVSLAAMIAIAIPLSVAGSLQESRGAVSDGDLNGALRAARDARAVEPFAAEPRLQEALVLEVQGHLAAAAAAAQEATALEPREWRAWVVRSRIEAERGRAAAALTAYRNAQSLNPRSSLFAK